jgi:hypothetical protein
LQALVVVFLRYLQTSLQNAQEDAEGTGKGFLCPKFCCAVGTISHGARGQSYENEDTELSEEEEEGKSIANTKIL